MCWPSPIHVRAFLARNIVYPSGHLVRPKNLDFYGTIFMELSPTLNTGMIGQPIGLGRFGPILIVLPGIM